LIPVATAPTAPLRTPRSRRFQRFLHLGHEACGLAGLEVLAGDQQASLVGQGCFEAGQAKCTYGTGAFLVLNTGATPVRSRNGLLTTVAWKLGKKACYALEGSTFIAGAIVQWLRDGLGIIRESGSICTSLSKMCSAMLLFGNRLKKCGSADVTSCSTAARCRLPRACAWRGPISMSS